MTTAFVLSGGSLGAVRVGMLPPSTLGDLAGVWRRSPHRVAAAVTAGHRVNRPGWGSGTGG